MDARSAAHPTKTFEQALTVATSELRKLRIEHGNPTYQEISGRAPGGRPLSPSGISETINGKVLPRLEFYMTLVRVLLAYDTGRLADHTDPRLAEWRARWNELKLLEPGRGRRAQGEDPASLHADAPHAAEPGLAERVVLGILRRGEGFGLFPMASDTGGVWAVTFSPDGQLIATGHGVKTAQLWDTVSQQRLGEPLMGHLDLVLALAFSPDSRLLATGSRDGTVRLWSTATREPLGAPLDGHVRGAWAVAFSPDGRLLATAGRSVRLWDVTDPGNPLKMAKPFGSGVSALAISPIGNLLATGNEHGAVQLWDTLTLQKVGEALRGHEKAITAMAFFPNGERFTTGSGDGTVQLWNTTTGEMLGEPLNGHDEPITALALAPDGKRLVTSGEDKIVLIWDTETGRTLGEPLIGHDNKVRALAYSPDARLLATGCHDGLLRLRIPGL